MRTCRNILISLSALLVFAAGLVAASNTPGPPSDIEFNPTRADTIENFDDGEIQLFSYPGQDIDTNAW
ncbi:MAG: hypothetical protein JSW49_08960, partial [candidate division WOR-3 bacterium]